MECGTDEAGRGCLAGPVTAAAVILPDDFKLPALNDSKKLTHKQREALRPIIEEKALSYAVCHVWMEEIDKINILNASITAMQRAIEQLDPKPEFIAVDGNRFKPVEEIPHECVIKGDGRYLHIAAASVLAKTYRDDIMLELHEKHPQYAWDANKGYPTQAHRTAIREFGSTPYHRMSFKLLPEQLKLDL
ncbi:ribonuclease HII [Gilvibacter sp.]|uniref:ribonuclease HII n=1 Tax=Gilvibacter sp. TaxID=2729997 RepID=UPI0025C436C0|nr:ribonuclease HII [Gilvibacter sp.]